MALIPDALLRVLAAVFGALLVRDGYAGLRGLDLHIPPKGYFTRRAARFLGAILMIAGIGFLYVAWLGFS